MSTLAQLKSDLGDLLADTTDERWPATTKVRALNKAYEKAASHIRLPSLQLSWTIPAIGGTASYAFSLAIPLSMAIKMIKSAWWGDKKPENKLTFVSEENFAVLDQTITSDKPTHYTIQSRTLILWPAPTVSATININGWMIVTPLSADTDVPVLPSDFHDYLPYYAAWKLLLMDKNSDDIPIAREYKSEFKDGLEELEIFHEEAGMEDDSIDQVSDSDDDGSSAFFGNL